MMHPMYIGFVMSSTIDAIVCVEDLDSLVPRPLPAFIYGVDRLESEIEREGESVCVCERERDSRCS